MKKPFVLASISACILGLSIGSLSTFALWQDNTEQDGTTIIPISQTSLNVSGDIQTNFSTDSLTPVKNGFSYDYPTQNALFHEDKVDAFLSDPDHTFSSVIRFDANSTVHRGISASVDTSPIVNAVSDANGAVFQGWISDPANCVSGVTSDDLDLTPSKTFVNSDAASENSAYYCVVITLPADNGSNGSYTNVGSVSGTTDTAEDEYDDDGNPIGKVSTSVEAEDSWTVNVGEEAPDYSAVREALKNPSSISVNMSTFRNKQ